MLCACRNLHGARRLYLHRVSHFRCRWHVHRRGLRHWVLWEPVRPFLHQPQWHLDLHRRLHRSVGGFHMCGEGGHAASRTYLYVLSSPPFPFKALILTWVLLCACRNLHGARRLYLHRVSHFRCRWHVHRRGLHHGLHRQPVRPFLHQPQRCLGLHWHLCR